MKSQGTSKAGEKNHLCLGCRKINSHAVTCPHYETTKNDSTLVEIKNIVARGFCVLFGTDMKYHKKEAEFLVFELGDFIAQALQQQHESDIQAFEEMLTDEDYPETSMFGHAYQDEWNKCLGRNQLRAELRNKLELLK